MIFIVYYCVSIYIIGMYSILSYSIVNTVLSWTLFIQRFWWLHKLLTLNLWFFFWKWILCMRFNLSFAWGSCTKTCMPVSLSVVISKCIIYEQNLLFLWSFNILSVFWSNLLRKTLNCVWTPRFRCLELYKLMRNSYPHYTHALLKTTFQWPWVSTY